MVPLLLRLLFRLCACGKMRLSSSSPPRRRCYHGRGPTARVGEETNCDSRCRRAASSSAVAARCFYLEMMMSGEGPKDGREGDREGREGREEVGPFDRPTDRAGHGIFGGGDGGGDGKDDDDDGENKGRKLRQVPPPPRPRRSSSALTRTWQLVMKLEAKLPNNDDCHRLYEPPS